MKEEIVAILVQHKGELGPSGSMRGGYTKPFPHWVRITLGGYELRGQVLSGGRFDVGPLLFDGESLFSSLYEGEISAVLFPRARSKAPAMAFNRKMVYSLALMKRDEIPEASNTQ